MRTLKYISRFRGGEGGSANKTVAHNRFSSSNTWTLFVVNVFFLSFFSLKYGVRKQSN